MKFYRINCSGTKFFLSENNINYDAPNMFTERFTKFPNATRIAIDKNPEIFSIIHKYLQGYVLPKLDLDILQDLLHDAEYYNFLKLGEIVRDKIDYITLYESYNTNPNFNYLEVSSGCGSYNEDLTENLLDLNVDLNESLIIDIDVEQKNSNDTDFSDNDELENFDKEFVKIDVKPKND